MQAPMDITQKKIVIFDLDGTLTETKSPMDGEMTGLFRQLLEKKRVAVISGGGFGQFKKQLLAALQCSPESCANLFLFPTSATRFYKYQGDDLVEVYADLMTVEERRKIKEAFERAFEDIGYQHPEKVYGEIVEDRGTQVTFSALGQDIADVLGEEGVRQKKEFRVKHEQKLKELTAAVASRLPEFEVRLAGHTSIDVTRKGIDKAYGIHQIEKLLGISRAQMLFVGDALYEGGNDYATKRTGVECIAVTGPEETKQLIRSWLNVL